MQKATNRKLTILIPEKKYLKIIDIKKNILFVKRVKSSGKFKNYKHMHT